MGSPAAVRSPRVGSAMIWAACLSAAHPSVPDAAAEGPGPSCRTVGCAPAGPAADDERLRNQFDVAALALAGTVSRGPVPACPGAMASRCWPAGRASGTGRVGMSVVRRPGKPDWAANVRDRAP